MSRVGLAAEVIRLSRLLALLCAIAYFHLVKSSCGLFFSSVSLFLLCDRSKNKDFLKSLQMFSSIKVPPKPSCPWAFAGLNLAWDRMCGFNSITSVPSFLYLSLLPHSPSAMA